MCGILGLVSPHVSQSDLERANDLLGHRGPDDAHIFIGEGVGLATRRLSIIDLAHGRQPLSNEDGTIWITYNGEVYNAPALRARLIAAGHRFQTDSDTEVVVHAYEEWGNEAVSRLRGMFAFGLWDGRRRRLLLARDRFGMKPLYYAQVNGRFAFASEIRPLFTALPQLARQANLEALWRLFEISFIPTPLTAFNDVYQLPAAHMMVVENGRSHPPAPYWQLNYAPSPSPCHIDEAAHHFMTHLRRGVDAWRLSDVPVGSLLSGGIDSSALAALLTEISGPIHTFHVAFEAATHDESAQARQTAVHLGSHHHELTFTTADFDHLPAVIRYLESPQSAMTSIPIYLLYKACREAGFKVILTGEGADELLGGYHWFDGDRRVRPLLPLPRPLRHLIAQAPLNISAASRRVLACGQTDSVLRYAQWHQLTTQAQRRRLFTPSVYAAIHQFPSISQQWLTQYMSAVNGRHPLDQFLYLESRTRLPDFINFEVDRMSMANSVEARPPFLDHQLWEFCATLPPDCKLRPRMNKRLLRLGMKALLPPSIRRQPKQGLAAPHAQWWRQEKLPAWAEECLGPTALQETGFFETGIVTEYRRAHQAGKADYSRLLTAILTTQLWHETV
jgi:asparagine synthase (glutamine-hydrolysing)